MKKFRVSKILLIFVIVAALVIGSSSISFATTVRKVSYLGSGNVDISFANKTSYKNNLRVAVKDTTGKVYQAKISSKKDTKLRIKIYVIKLGRKYKVTISGLKDGETYASFNTVSKKKAISIAKNKAEKLGAKSFNDVAAENTAYRNIGAWRITFDSNGSKYMYLISQQTGLVLRSEKN